MNISRTIGAVATLCQGLIAGILVGYLASRPARAAMDVSDFVQYQQIVHVYYQPMMQSLMAVAILSGAAWLVTFRGAWRSIGAVFAIVSFVGILAVFGVTLAVNVPINNMLMTWTAASPLANVRDLWAPWETVHLVRTITAVVAFAAAVIALSRGRRA